MLRLFRRATRSAFPRRLPSSRPSHLTQIHSREPVVTQRVKLSRPGIRLKNVLIGTTVVSVCYALYSSVVLSPLVRWAEELEDQLSPEERKRLDEAEPIFIALPLTTRIVQPPPYSITDPEWKQYVDIARNSRLQASIRRDFAQMIRFYVEQSVFLRPSIGDDPQITKYWIDIGYPNKPPPVYLRSGILITDDAVAIVERPVDASTVHLLNRVLWPAPVFFSTWAFGDTLFKQIGVDIARMFGYETKTSGTSSTAPNSGGPSSHPAGPSEAPPSHHPDIEKAIQRIQQQVTSRPENVKGPRTVQPPPSASQDGQGSTPTSEDEGDLDGTSEWFPGHGTVREWTTRAFRDFTHTFARHRKNVREYDVPRGSLIVWGLVQLETSRAILVIDGFAFYDPKTGQVDPKSATLRLRRLAMKHQPSEPRPVQ
ncbi:hypothetical protein VTK73DRAFT_4206 [Phialemonium thermophilum]|uniref:Uncharacterized protein n=1 Tax=Phialemonium thermophilum TaxID=223376 RepID=A0ABR3WV51_9PEZI